MFFFARLSFSMALAVAFPLSAMNSASGAGPEYFDFDESLAEKWKESDVVPPPYPEDKDLLPVPMQVTDTLRIYIDRVSLSLDADRVARFTLVAESPSGARSVFYEGIRCETREYKTYAIGNPEREFTPFKGAQWRRITQPALNAFRYQLFRHYACGDHDSARAPAEIVKLLTR